MAITTLTGQRISDTYTKLTQTENKKLYDAIGTEILDINLLKPIAFSGNYNDLTAAPPIQIVYTDTLPESGLGGILYILNYSELYVWIDDWVEIKPAQIEYVDNLPITPKNFTTYVLNNEFVKHYINESEGWRSLNFIEIIDSLPIEGESNKVYFVRGDGLYQYIYGDTSEWVKLSISSGNFIRDIYENIVNLATNSLLVPGTKYIMTDYRSVYQIPNTADIGVCDIETLILTAETESTFSPIAASYEFPQDHIYYDINNNLDMVPGCTKGYIYRRIDTIKNNDIGFDYRNVKFRRWQINVTDQNSDGNATYQKYSVVLKTGTDEIYIKLTDADGPFNDISYWKRFEWDNLKYVSPADNVWNINTITIPCSNLFKDFYMFSTEPTDSGIQSDYSAIYNNTISQNLINIINNISSVFFGTSFYSNTIGNNFRSNTIGNNFRSNTIGYNFESNTIGNNFESNTIGYYFISNTIGNNFISNTIGYEFYSNTIGYNFYSNRIGNYFYSNTIGYNFASNTIGDTFESNTIGNNFYSNTIGYNFYSNTIGNNFISNTIGDNFESNTIGNNFYSNTIGDNFESNITPMEFKNNKLDDGFDSNDMSTFTGRVCQSYYKQIVKNEDGIFKIMYIDTDNTLVITDID